MRTELPPPWFDFWFSFRNTVQRHVSLSLEPEIKKLDWEFFIKARNKINIVTETLPNLYTYIQYNHIWTTCSVNLCTAKLFIVFPPDWRDWELNKALVTLWSTQQLSMLALTYSSKAMASRQSKEALNSVLRWGPLVAKLGTFSVPFSLRQEEVMVALQHSRWHGGVVDCLHGASAEQLAVQPAVHFMSELTISFFSCKGKRSDQERTVGDL